MTIYRFVLLIAGAAVFYTPPVNKYILLEAGLIVLSVLFLGISWCPKCGGKFAVGSMKGSFGLRYYYYAFFKNKCQYCKESLSKGI